ncbi:MAG: helix-turn-helix transcriptional regulator [Bacteroidota bacterium]
MIERLIVAIEARLNDNNLSNKDLAKSLGMSERNFSRKMHQLTGMPPQKYVRQYRLERAMDFIKEGKFFTVNEIANAVGFIKADYFSYKFEEHFGKKPYQLLREMGLR